MRHRAQHKSALTPEPGGAYRALGVQLGPAVPAVEESLPISPDVHLWPRWGQQHLLHPALPHRLHKPALHLALPVPSTALVNSRLQAPAHPWNVPVMVAGGTSRQKQQESKDVCFGGGGLLTGRCVRCWRGRRCAQGWPRRRGRLRAHPRPQRRPAPAAAPALRASRATPSCRRRRAGAWRARPQVTTAS
eukprot:1883707-Rhodomonas_salina.1